MNNASICVSHYDVGRTVFYFVVLLCVSRNGLTFSVGT